MKIYEIKLTLRSTQIIKIPEKSEIMDIQLQNGLPIMFVISDSENKEIEVKINRYFTGAQINNNRTIDKYITTVRYKGTFWHFFMNYEF